jgi:hypothetical protein
VRFPIVVLCLAPLTLAGCKIAYRPPLVPRGDGGPVAIRGVVTHESRSELRLYRDASGCESVQTLNRQFRLVSLGASQPIVLEESYDVRRCLSSEGTRSEATVTAWRPDTLASEPLFRFTGRGVAGEPVGDLYRMVITGCCGSQDAATYYSLQSGQALFTSSVPPLRIETSPGQLVRYVGLYGTYAAIGMPEAARDSAVVAVLQYATDRAPRARLVIRSSIRNAFAAARLTLVRPDSSSDSSAVLMGSTVSDLTIRGELVAPSTDRRVWFEIPIEKDALAIHKAQSSPELSLRLLR